MTSLWAQPYAQGPSDAGNGHSPPDLDEARAALRKLRELLHAAAAHASSEEDLVAHAASIACDFLGYRACGAALRGDDGNFRYFSYSNDGAAERPPAQSVLGASAYGAMSRAALGVEGAMWLPAGHDVLRLPEVREGLAKGRQGWDDTAFFWAPFTGEDGGHIGFLNADDRCKGGPPGDLEALLLVTVAGITSLGLQVVRADAAGRRSAAVARAQRRQLEEMIAASLEVRGQAALDDALANIARAMASAAGFGRAAIYLAGAGPSPVTTGGGFDPQGDADLGDVAMSLVATVGLDPLEADRLRDNFTRLSSFAPMMRPEMRLGRCYLFDHRFFSLPPEFLEKLSRAPEGPDEWVDGMWHPEDSLTVPLEDRQGYLVGVISLDEPLNRALPSADDCRALELFADQCALAVSESRRLEAALEEATTDELTGLANRRAFLERAPEMVLSARRSGVSCSALYVDIDHFKDVNDSFGHATGDEVIAAVGRAIAHRLRRGDLLARYGGEEFVALLPATGLEEAAALAEEIRRLVAGSELVAVNPPIELHISVGVAALRAGDDTRALLCAADAALYQAKRGGRDRVCVAPA